jgi:hypothetical protein
MPEDFVIDNLQGILDSIELIETRFVGVANSDGFVLNADGVLTLDSICMRLQKPGRKSTQSTTSLRPNFNVRMLTTKGITRIVNNYSD